MNTSFLRAIPNLAKVKYVAKSTLVVTALFCCIKMTGCGSGTNDGKQVDFVKIDCPGLASNSSYEENMYRIINNQHEYREFYLATNIDSQNEPPNVNFENHTVIFLNGGFKPSTGHSLEVTSIQEESGKLRVYLQESEPQSCPADTAITYPYCYVSIGKTNKKIEFSSETVDSCK